MDENKSKALGAALSQIEKQFGKNTVMRLGDNTVQAVEAVSTGSLTLDIALGIGGLPKGRIIEIYGPESSGKTNDFASDCRMSKERWHLRIRRCRTCTRS